MSEGQSLLKIRVYAIDGSAQTFVENEGELVNRTIKNLNPALLMRQDRILVEHDGTFTAFLPSLLARVDLVTDRLSVWDFPFVLGAPVELTESEYLDELDNLRGNGPSSWQADTQLFLNVATVNGQHTFLALRIISGGLPERLAEIYSLLNHKELVFGLREGGVGVLNLANLLGFTVSPDPHAFSKNSARLRHHPTSANKWMHYQSSGQKPKNTTQPYL